MLDGPSFSSTDVRTLLAIGKTIGVGFVGHIGDELAVVIFRYLEKLTCVLFIFLSLAFSTREVISFMAAFMFLL